MSVRKPSIVIAVIGAVGAIVAAVVTGGFGLLEDAPDARMGVPTSRTGDSEANSPSGQGGESSALVNPGTISAPVVLGDAHGDVADGNIDKSTTINFNPSAYEQVRQALRDEDLLIRKLTTERDDERFHALEESQKKILSLLAKLSPDDQQRALRESKQLGSADLKLLQDFRKTFGDRTILYQAVAASDVGTELLRHCGYNNGECLVVLFDGITPGDGDEWPSIHFDIRVPPSIAQIGQLSLSDGLEPGGTFTYVVGDFEVVVLYYDVHEDSTKLGVGLRKLN